MTTGSASRLIMTLVISLLVRESRAADVPKFEKDIRPILKAHCFHCHGESGEREGGLDLRLRRFIAAGGDSGTAINPDEPDSSLLLDRIANGEMPPDEDKQLSSADVDLVRRWLRAGAPTARPEPESIGDGPLFTAEERSYWAFQPIVRPPVPAVHSPVIRSPIDAFLLARMQEKPENDDEPLQFARPADRSRLVRRLWILLTGLPPRPEDVRSFLDDPAPDAYERLVEQLLSSPHYGERWGRHWLDVAGYADSEGYTDADQVREHAWRYRDYVIRAFNEDMPFDEFVTEQLAGDELVPLPHANLDELSQRRLTATGFLRMAPDGTGSGGIDQNVARNQVMADTLQIVGTSLLGLTVHCAQCHDHRYDPIPTRDYYRMRAVFEPALDWKSWKPPASRRISLYTDADREAAARIEDKAKQVETERSEQAEKYITRTLEEELLLVDEPLQESLRTAYRTAGKDRSDEQTALLKEYPSVANISVGSLYLYDRRREERARKLDQQTRDDEARIVEELKKKALAEIPEEKRATVEEAVKTDADKRTETQQALLATHPRVSVTAATLAQFDKEAADRFAAARKEAKSLRESKAADHLKEFADRAAEIRATKPEEGFLRVLSEPAGHLPQSHIFFRGDHEQPKDAVGPGLPSILPGNPDLPSNDESKPTSGRRLAFARAITDPDHPLLARVIVNRLWLHHFDRGLVNSPGDFGILGEAPSHPRLLDWLAREFIDSRFSVKHIHGLIVKSAAFRQSSRPETAALERDPENRLYTRFQLRRVESEIVRDLMLELSGQRNQQMFGKPVPVMEDGVGQIVLGIESLDGERKPNKALPLNGAEFRRSIYVQVRRTRTLSLFDTFDAPAMTPNCERRSASTVALQSLLLMNGDFLFDVSARIARRLEREAADSLENQVRLGWQLAFSADPDPDDVRQAVEFITLQSQRIREEQPKIDETESRRQALDQFCHALLGSNRFLYVE